MSFALVPQRIRSSQNRSKMDMQSSTAVASMSEMVAVNVNGNSSSISNGTNTTNINNKRKRRSSFAEIENQRPASKKVYVPSAADEFDSSSDIENGSIDSDVYSGSPQSTHLRQKIDGSIRSTVSTNTNHINNNNNSIDKSNLNSNNNNNNNNTQTVKETMITVNGQIPTLTPINQNNIGAIHVSELTPQNSKKTEQCIKCPKCHSKNELHGRRICPLPLLSWADADRVWRYMCDKDKRSSLERSPQMLQKHQGLQPRMRAILLDWLNEVCEVYKLHRETYYLALDYLDRYLSTNTNISKTFLQLIGITCLFIAAKVEEIYPPKLNEFAYVTDGACTERDILRQELIILTALKWQTSPITIIGWLGIYMQLNASKRTPKTFVDSTPSKKPLPKETKLIPIQNASHNDIKSATAATSGADDGFVFPQFSGLAYAQTAQLIDLCTLDVGIANYPYSVIAAAAISHTYNKNIAVKLSGLDWATIDPCNRWMEPYFQICLQAPRLALQERHEQFDTKGGLGSVCPNINTDESHIIQAHTTNIDMFDQATLYREQSMQESSPAPIRTGLKHVCPPDGLLTPPDSSRKFVETHPDSTHKELN